jgi:adenylate cyclase
MDFTTLSEKIAPEHLVILLGQYLKEMERVIQNQMGCVDKFIGDAIMAIFGAPKSIKDHAINACFAALAMQEALTLLNSKWKIEGKPFLKQKIGINTGDVVVGNIGSENRFDYTVIEDSVNLASRLESLNKFYETKILVGKETRELAKELFLFKPIDLVRVKGKEIPELIYELIGVIDKDSKFQEELIQIYSRGFEYYLNKQFNESVEIFKSYLNKTQKEDLATDILIKRCESYIKTPPPDNWDGVFTMTNK